MAKARDVMTPKPLTLASGLDLEEAVEFFLQHDITTAPVQNPLGEILGQMTDLDLVKALVHSRAKPEMKKVAHAMEFFEPVTFIGEDEHVAAVVRAVVKSPVHRVLVKDKQDRVTGIISPKDLLRGLNGESAAAAVVADEVQALQREVEQLRSRLGEMNSYLQTYDTVFQSGLFGLHSADREGRISFANERLHAMLGYAPGELVGKTIFDLYAPEVHVEARAGLKKVMHEGRHALTFSAMAKKDGASLQVDLASAALRDEGNHFIGTFTISRAHGTEAMKVNSGNLFETGVSKQR